MNNPASYVLLVTASSYILSSWLGIRIGPFRKAANVPHPHVSVPREIIANATSLKEKRDPSFLTAMLIAGLNYPKLSAAAGFVWMLGRVVYAIGYTRDVKQNIKGQGRFFLGGFHAAALSQVGLIVLVGKMGVDLLQA